MAKLVNLLPAACVAAFVATKIPPISPQIAVPGVFGGLALAAYGARAGIARAGRRVWADMKVEIAGPQGWDAANPGSCKVCDDERTTGWDRQCDNCRDVYF